MYHAQPAYGFSTTSTYMSGWPAAYPSTNVGHPMYGYPMQSIPFNAGDLPQQPPTSQYTPPRTSAYGGTRQHTPPGTSAYGGTRQHTTAPQSSASQTPGALVPQRKTCLPADIIGNIFPFIQPPHHPLRLIGSEYSSAYLRAKSSWQRRLDCNRLVPFIHARYTLNTRCFTLLRTICANQIHTVDLTTQESWLNELTRAQDEDLIAFFQNLMQRPIFAKRQEMNLHDCVAAWAREHNRTEDLKGDSSVHAKCIRDWMRSHQKELAKITGIIINGLLFYEWPKEASLLVNLQQVRIDSYCRQHVLASIGAIPSVNRIIIESEQTDMHTAQDWPQSVFNTTKDRTIAVRSPKLSRLFPGEQIKRFLGSGQVIEGTIATEEQLECCNRLAEETQALYTQHIQSFIRAHHHELHNRGIIEGILNGQPRYRLFKLGDPYSNLNEWFKQLNARLANAHHALEVQTEQMNRIRAAPFSNYRAHVTQPQALPRNNEL